MKKYHVEGYFEGEIEADSEEEALEIFSITDLNESDEVNVTYVDEEE